MHQFATLRDGVTGSGVYQQSFNMYAANKHIQKEVI